MFVYHRGILGPMARQARIEYENALHHVRSRGNSGLDIFYDDQDRLHFLALLAEAVRHYGWLVTAWVLMTNHVHLVIQTPIANLSDGMKWLLGSYVTWFNARHGRTGHLFGDRFHSDLVEKQSYLTELVRYVVLNPVRAKMVERPEDFRWSNFRATAGMDQAPAWLSVASLAPYFGEPDSWQGNYRSYVEEKIGSTERLWDKLENGIYLGSEAWCKSIRKLVESKMLSDVHPRVQRTVGRPKMAHIVTAVAQAFGVQRSWIQSIRGTEARLITAWIGWYEGLQRLRSIAAALRLQSSGRVSDMIRECERRLFRSPALKAKLHLAFAALA